MKTNALISVGLGLLALCGSMNAQQNYYHFNGAGLNDHGYGNEVIQATIAPTGVIVAGAAFTTANVPSCFIAKYDNAGNALFHKFYKINPLAVGSVNEAIGVVEATTAAVPGFGLLCYTNAAPAQTVLIKTDLAGNFLWQREIGPLRGASIAYDATLKRFLCLTQVFLNNTNQVHLVVVDANAGGVVFNRVFDGCGLEDSPVTVIHDVTANEYVCLGNSRSTTDNQIMVSKVTPANVLIYTRIFGDAARAEIAVDLVRNPAAANYTIAGYISGVTNTPFFATLDLPGAVANILPANGLAGNNTPRRMAFINNRFMMVGKQVDAMANTNGFLLSATATLAPADYRIYGQPPAAGSEELRDISLSNVVATPTLMCGTHQRTVAWLGSPANTSYNWLVFANNVGAGTCPQNFLYTLSSYAPAIKNCTFTEFILNPTVVTQSSSTQAVTALDECLFPNIAQPDPTPQQAKPISSDELGPNRMLSNGSSFAQVYPNPASGALNIAIVLEKGSHAVMNLFDMTGRLVRTESLDDQSTLLVVNVADLPEGVYFCRIHSSTGILTEQKVVVKH
jgi:hypothetical protein